METFLIDVMNVHGASSLCGKKPGLRGARTTKEHFYLALEEALMVVKASRTLSNWGVIIKSE